MKIGIFGAGGFGREVLPEVRALHPHSDIAFVVDECETQKQSINGINVIDLDRAVDEERTMVIAVGDWRTRKRVFEIVESNGLGFLEVVARDAVIYDEVNIAGGAVICSKSIITSNVKIGKSFQCNLFSYVAHDCVVGDFVTLAPRVCCNGNVIIEDGAYIGTGAVIKQGSRDKPIIIGQNSIVGMGAVVTKDVPPNSTVIGNPAKILQKNQI